MMSDKFVENTAKAIYTADAPLSSWDSATEMARDVYRMLAHAALAVAFPAIRNMCSEVARASAETPDPEGAIKETAIAARIDALSLDGDRNG